MVCTNYQKAKFLAVFHWLRNIYHLILPSTKYLLAGVKGVPSCKSSNSLANHVEILIAMGEIDHLLVEPCLLLAYAIIDLKFTSFLILRNERNKSSLILSFFIF